MNVPYRTAIQLSVKSSCQNSCCRGAVSRRQLSKSSAGNRSVKAHQKYAQLCHCSTLNLLLSSVSFVDWFAQPFLCFSQVVFFCMHQELTVHIISIVLLVVLFIFCVCQLYSLLFISINWPMYTTWTHMLVALQRRWLTFGYCEVFSLSWLYWVT